MTNDERDKMISESHNMLLGLAPLVKAHEKDINGNGQPGMKERLTQMETSHGECQKRQGAQPAVHGNWIAVAALLVCLAGIVVQLYTGK